jgi:hypothetical protein
MRLRLIVPLLLLLPLLAAAVLWAASLWLGRTPAELLGAAARMSRSAAWPGPLAAPLLERAAIGYAGDAAGGALLPFEVPRLPPNPAASAPPPAAAAPVAGRIRVGPLREVRTLARAAALAADGDTIEIDPGDYRADVAVWTQDRLTIRASGPQVRLIAAGAAAEGKAIWVLRGGRITVEGIEFIGARVPDRNGAGIRLERGHLVLRHCRFIDNEGGVLASPHPDTVLEIVQSEFSHNGAGDGRTHHVYANQIRRLEVTGSWFHHANLGHLIKSRAATSLIAYNRLTDEVGGRASYELEFPNGGDALVLGNIVQQGSQTGNSVMVAYGAEGLQWPLNRLRMAHNTLVNDHPHGGSFVRVWGQPELTLLLDNLLVGRGRTDLPADAVQQRNPALDWADLVQPAREDYRLQPAARRRLPAVPVAEIDAALLPRQEYRHPLGLQPLSGPLRWPGALQSGPE